MVNAGGEVMRVLSWQFTEGKWQLNREHRWKLRCWASEWWSRAGKQRWIGNQQNTDCKINGDDAVIWDGVELANGGGEAIKKGMKLTKGSREVYFVGGDKFRKLQLWNNHLWNNHLHKTNESLMKETSWLPKFVFPLNHRYAPWLTIGMHHA